MRMARRKEGMSYGELADYQDLVEDVKANALKIAEMTDYYWIENGGLVCDGDVYSSQVKSMIYQIQQDLKGISQYCRKYGDL